MFDALRIRRTREEHGAGAREEGGVPSLVVVRREEGRSGGSDVADAEPIDRRGGGQDAAALVGVRGLGALGEGRAFAARGGEQGGGGLEACGGGEARGGGGGVGRCGGGGGGEGGRGCGNGFAAAFVAAGGGEGRGWLGGGGEGGGACGAAGLVPVVGVLFLVAEFFFLRGGDGVLVYAGFWGCLWGRGSDGGGVLLGERGGGEVHLRGISSGF